MKLASATNLNRKSGGAKRRGGTCSFTSWGNGTRRHPPTALSLCPKVKLQVPPLRFAPVGMTNLRVRPTLRVVEVEGQSRANLDKYDSQPSVRDCSRGVENYLHVRVPQRRLRYGKTIVLPVFRTRVSLNSWLGCLAAGF